MSLMRRSLAASPWPDWFSARSLFDWPESLPALVDDDRLRVEEFREGDTLVVRAEMPGIDPDKDVEITVTDGLLRLKAERTEEERTEDKRGYRSEFRYGSFARAVRLPVGATEDDVKATYHDGILEVRVPISSEQATARKIPVGRG